MITSSADITQAIIELFDLVVCVVAMMFLYIITKLQKRSAKIIFAFLMVSIVLLSADACWYLVDGVCSPIGRLLNPGCIFFVFISNSLLLILATEYSYALLWEKNIAVSPIFRWISHSASVLAMFFEVVNVWHPWMYDFTADNIYFRYTGWYVYTGLLMAALFCMVTFSVCYRKHFDKMMLSAILIFYLAPFIFAALQMLIMGIALTIIGVTTSLLFIVFSYLRMWAGNEQSLQREEYHLFTNLYITMVICIIVSVLAGVLSICRLSDSQSRDTSRVLAHMVSEAIESDFMEPITISETMSISVDLHKALKAQDIDGTVTEQELVDYLYSIYQQMGYSNVFAVSDITNAYYNQHGICKYINPGEDPKDIWYSQFWKIGKPYSVRVDKDETNQGERSIFINTAVTDTEGSRIGISGIAISMKQFQEVLKEYEEEYHLRIRLMTKQGLVQVDSDSQNISKLILPHDYLTEVTDSDFYYQRLKNSAVLTKYMKNLNWYLVIEDTQPNKINIFMTILPSIVTLVIVILVILGSYQVFRTHEQMIIAELEIKKQEAHMDKMTGVLNRFAFETDKLECYAKENDFNQTVLMMDINGLKIINDTMGHAVGDEVIIGAANCAMAVLSSYGKIYRFGGDEFVAVLNCSTAQLSDLLKQLRDSYAQWQGQHISELHVSVGYASRKDNPSVSIEDLVKIADDEMYQEKAIFYQQTENDRRRSKD